MTARPGSWDGSPDLDAAILRKAVEAYTSPRQRADGTAAPASERLSAGQRRGQAFCLLLRHLPVDGLPQHGGTPVSIVVTVAEADLRRSTGAGTLDTADRLSVTGVRQLARTQGLLPAVLGGDGEVLDLGRSRRLFQPAQRRAHLLHHQTCQEESCDVPAAWTEAHHKRPWAEGGRTDLADLAFLCFLHHHRAHDPKWSVEWSSSGAARFRRRE
ncbi:DUF222 domain-containing protein [Nocardioides sp. SYSU DS0651]|uniref:HNH endonuclease signature motif containing protein n=1 Tax=Nocardioides sp. SYSU DS0651 TaxID=3415955 RepID=UPI003F4B3AE6